MSITSIDSHEIAGERQDDLPCYACGVVNHHLRAGGKSKISILRQTLHEARLIFPPLKKLLFEIFWFLFAVIEIVRFLKGLV